MFADRAAPETPASPAASRSLELSSRRTSPLSSRALSSRPSGGSSLIAGAKVEALSQRVEELQSALAETEEGLELERAKVARIMVCIFIRFHHIFTVPISNVTIPEALSLLIADC